MKDCDTCSHKRFVGYWDEVSCRKNCSMGKKMSLDITVEDIKLMIKKGISLAEAKEQKEWEVRGKVARALRHYSKVKYDTFDEEVKKVVSWRQVYRRMKKAFTRKEVL